VIHTVWAGGTPPDSVRQGLAGIAAMYPDEEKVFWVQPNRTRPTAAADFEAMQRMGQEAGFQVRDVSDHVGELTEGLDGKAGMVRDIISWEMASKGEIAVKDLTTYLVLGRHGGLAMDTSVQATAEGPSPQPQGDLRVPKLADSGIARNVGQPGYEAYAEVPRDRSDPPRGSLDPAEPHDLPHLDVWTMYARQGTDGQRVMQAAADKFVGYYGELVNAGIKDNQITRWPEPDRGVQPNHGVRSDAGEQYDRTRLKLATVDPQSQLGTKWNPSDGYRQQIIGGFAMGALYEGIHAVYGREEPSTAVAEMVRVEVPQAVWADITWNVEPHPTLPGRHSVPEMNLTKEYRGSWRDPGTEAVGRAAVSVMKLPGEPTAPGYQASAPGTRRDSDPAAVAAMAVPPATRPVSVDGAETRGQLAALRSSDAPVTTTAAGIQTAGLPPAAPAANPAQSNSLR
jgi:hypothetical protein